MNDKLSSNSG